MKTVNEVQKLPYWSEEYLYFLKNLLLGQKAARKPVSNAFYLIPPEKNYSMVYMRLGSLSKKLGFAIKLKFHKDVYVKYLHPAVLATSDDPSPKGSLAELYDKILASDITTADFDGMLLGSLFNGMAEFIEFKTDLDIKTLRKIRQYLDDYIKLFMKDELKDEIQNYVRYQKMKEQMMKGLFDLYNNYGDDFIVDKNKFIYFTLSFTANEYLFVHTLLALENEGLIRIDYFWVDDLDSNPESKVAFIGYKGAKANITLTKAFLDEAENKDYISSLDKPLKPKKTLKQEQIPQLKFDSVKSVLFVGSTRVEIRNHSNQYELLKIVFENPKEALREWFYDEMIGRYDSTGSMKEKTFENAAYQLNNKIIRDTGLRDVMEVKKRSVIFNKKYEIKT
ncbi:MAG TPA: hypothetical protein VMV71_04185 [Candidatus Paceibacterota bacterium]|nr:hypothetical protein [Candidatus Paceibacterota bacterium]